ncbi:MAG: amidohydrolase family protein [Bacilli bacterium]|jgi:putative selenium metabolism protein SsnA
MRQALINVQIYDFETYISKGYVVFEDKILSVGPMDEFIDRGYVVIDGEGRLVMPGLVCGHTHIYSAFARGLSVPFNPKNFQDILDQLWWKLDRHLDNEASYYSGLVAASDFLQGGVTSIIDHHASGKQITGSLDSVRRGLDEVGLRGAFAFEVSDRFPTNEAIKENRIFIDAHRTGTARGLFGLHASMSLSDRTLAKVKQKLGADPIHVHVAESELDQTDCLKRYGKRVVERFDDFGLINPDSLLVHAIHVDDHELDLIKLRKATIAVNVSSNLNNGVGLPDVLKMLEKDIPVILGNDGMTYGMAHEYVTVNLAMHHRYGGHRNFGLKHLWRLIDDTYRYASRLFDIKLGRIKPGYEADLVMVPYVAPTPMTSDNAFGHLVFGLFDHFKPQNVFVAGVPRLRDYRLVATTIESKFTQARQVAARLWKNIQSEDK